MTMCEHANEVPRLCRCPQDCPCRLTMCKLREREGDQPLPVPNTHPHIHDLVCDDMQRRKAVGVARYGVALQPHNGRDALRDAYEEVLDTAVYLKQAIVERDGLQQKSRALCSQCRREYAKWPDGRCEECYWA